MKNLLSLAMALCFPYSVFANDHDHENFPENALLVLEGKDAITKEYCALYIVDISDTSIQVETSYSHGQDQAETIHVPLVLQKKNSLVGASLNGRDQIAIFLPSPSIDIQNAQSFNLKWWHTNHAHTSKCLYLKVHSHNDDSHR